MTYRGHEPTSFSSFHLCITKSIGEYSIQLAQRRTRQSTWIAERQEVFDRWR